MARRIVTTKPAVPATVSTYTTSLSGCRPVEATSPEAAARIFADRYARRVWGQSAKVTGLRNVEGATYRADLGRAHCLRGGGVNMARWIEFTVCV